MPSRKRPSAEPAKTQNDTNRPGSSPAASEEPGTKRQRVSLACDHCRAARSRCDGHRPSCDVCLSQQRECSYTSSNRRRGTPTGYLRAVESSLAYLLEQNPENVKHLSHLLKNDADVFTDRTGKASGRLHKRWSTSRYRKDMWRLLVDGYPSAPESDASKDEDTFTEGDDFSKPQTDLSLEKVQLNTPPAEDAKSFDTAPPPQPNARLPSNWQHLLEVYFAYTHCWLPILDHDALLATAASFPPDGIPQSLISDVSPLHAELWAVLALASFQDAASHEPPVNSPSLQPRNIYSIARNMMPSEEKRFELPHLRALLLHSLVLMGQGAGLAAWMLIGTGVRLALHLRETGEIYATDDGTTPSPGTRAFAASLVLNTLASAYLGQPTFLSVDTQELSAAIDEMADASENESWTPTLGNTSEPVEINPLQNFRQFYKLAQVLSALLRAGGWRSNPDQGSAATKRLISCLWPEYSFCNSVVLGSSTPSVPSAFVLHAVFLTALTQCASGQRSSLLSSLREVVENCESEFGPSGVPPVIVCLAGTALRSRHASKMDAYEKGKWDKLATSLRTIWTSRANGSMHKSTGTAIRHADMSLLGQTPETLVESEMSQLEPGNLLDMQMNPPCPTTANIGSENIASWNTDQPLGYDAFLDDMEFAWLDSSTPYLC